MLIIINGNEPQDLIGTGMKFVTHLGGQIWLPKDGHQNVWWATWDKESYMIIKYDRHIWPTYMAHLYGPQVSKTTSLIGQDFAYVDELCGLAEPCMVGHLPVSCLTSDCRGLL